MKTIFFLQLVATLIFNLVSIRILEKKKTKQAFLEADMGLQDKILRKQHLTE